MKTLRLLTALALVLVAPLPTVPLLSAQRPLPYATLGLPNLQKKTF